MWRCDPPTRIVLAALAGLVACAVHAGPLALLAPLAGRPRIALLAAAAAAVLWGGMRVDALERRVLHPGPVHGVVVVTGRPNGDRAIGRLAGSGEDVVLSVRSGGLVPGGIYRVGGRLVPIDPELRGYYANQGVHLELDASDAVAAGRRGGAWGAVDRLHDAALAKLGAASDPSPERALVAGVALGEGDALPYDLREQFRASGLTHIVAASGQNVALVVVLTLIALGLCGVIGPPARWAALALTLLYVLIAGAGPSIVRAGVAGGLTLTAWLASRPVARWHLVACGAVVVLAVNPLSLFDPGFQLSFAAVAAIMLVAPRVHGTLAQAVAISVACTLATAPIAWWHFGRVAPMSVPANLLALPAVAPILWLGLCAVVLGAAWPPLAAPLLWLADVLSAYVIWVAGLCS
jgi:competence protein ComEC